MENRKRIRYISAGIVLLLIVSMLIYISTFIQPKIDFTAEINNVSDEDYKRILDNGQVLSPEEGIEKFKHINFHIKVTIPFNLISNVNIQKDILQKYIQNNDKIQDLSGGSFEHGNGREYAENCEIYLKNITEDELKAMLGDFRVKVAWKDMLKDSNEKNFYFRDYLK